MKSMSTPSPHKLFGEQFLFKDGKIYKKCQECGGWSPRSKWLNNGDWVYGPCLRCKCFEGSPTEWAMCSVKGILSRDTVWNDCFTCDFYVQMKVTYDPQGSRPCPKFTRLLKFNDVYQSDYLQKHGLKIIEV